MNKNKVLAIVLFIALIILSVYSILWKENLRRLPQRYVIGKITRISKSATSGFQVDYSYKLNNQSYNNSMALGYYQGKVFRDEHYIVSIPDQHPGDGLMMLECLVNDSLREPDEGWDKIPIKCNPPL